MIGKIDVFQRSQRKWGLGVGTGKQMNGTRTNGGTDELSLDFYYF